MFKHNYFRNNQVLELFTLKYYPSLAKQLFTLAQEIRNKTGICLSFIDLSGGIGIPYKPEEKKVDIIQVCAQVKEV